MPVTIDASAPPPSSTPRSSSAGNPKPLARKTKERAENLAELGTLGSTGLILAKQYADAGTVTKYWPALSLEVAKLAEDNDKIGEALDNLAKVGPYAGIIAVVLPFALQIAANHEKAPVVPQLGVVPPAVLEAEVKSSLLRMEIEAKALQMALEKEAREAQKEYEAFAASQVASQEAGK